MEYPHDTPLTRKNKHLSPYERGQIKFLYDQGRTAYAIAKILGRAQNTIRNELARGTVEQIKGKKHVMIYYPDSGQTAYERSRKNCCPRYKILQCERFINHVVRRMRSKKHSLDAIVGQAKTKKWFLADEMVCTKTLYNYVEQGLLPIRNIDLPLKVRRKTRSSGIRRNKRILGTSIEERPCQVNDRTEFGHWEIDTVIGRKTKGEAVLLTLTERKTREEVIRKLPEKSAEAVMDSLQNLARTAGDLFPVVFKSITADNGSEFSDLALLEERLGPKVYFAHPYRSGERGTNEVHNGLIRRFIPKGKSLSDYSTSSLERIQQWCNSLPRKVLGYQTPHEAFLAELAALSFA